MKEVISSDREGLYSLIFVRCDPLGSYTVSFTSNIVFKNQGPNYLSAGDMLLPLIYLCCFILFACIFAVWIYVLNNAKRYNITVHPIHYLMTLLIILKCITLLVDSIRYHYISLVGSYSSETWNIIYYIFALFKGLMLFLVILLIGSGWSLTKVSLNNSEKYMIGFVLCLQVINNIAMIILEETAPGTQLWLTWKDILHFVDIICCCCILFPIIWSIKHLQQISSNHNELNEEEDIKIKRNLSKIYLFREFYVMVIIYIYFTRFIVYFLEAFISFHQIWMSVLFSEIGTLVFYVITGYKFQPMSERDNTYLPVKLEENEGKEYGLNNEDDIEITLVNRKQ